MFRALQYQPFPEPSSKKDDSRDDVVVNCFYLIKFQMRTSFIPQELLIQVIKEQDSKYGNQIFQNPYVEKLDKAFEDSEISVLHLAANNNNSRHLEKCLKVCHANVKDIYGRTPLFYGVFANNLSNIKKLVKAGANLDHQDIEGRTVIHWATYFNRSEIIKTLVGMGANPRIRDNCGRTPLHMAVSLESRILEFFVGKFREFEINEGDNDQLTPVHWAVYHNKSKNVKKLIESGADILKTDIQGKNPLHWCATLKSLKCAKLLVKKNVNLINMGDLDGRTPLHLACGENNQKLVLLIISQTDCLINNTDCTGKTALHWACLSGHHQLVGLLLRHGAKDDITDKNCASPLHYSASKNHTACVQTLLSSSKPYLAPDSLGRTALFWAASKGQADSVKALLTKIDPNQSDKDGRTGKKNTHLALHDAALNGHGRCVEILIQNNARINIYDKFHRTCIFGPVENGHTEVVSILVNNGADVNHEDCAKRSPIHWCALYGNVHVLSILLSSSGDVNKKDIYGKTALHCAVYDGRDEVVKYLIEFGANLNSMDNNGFSPLHWAATVGHQTTCELLLSRGAKANLIACSEMTPLDYSEKMKNEEISNLLLKYGAKKTITIQFLATLAIQKMWKKNKKKILNTHKENHIDTVKELKCEEEPKEMGSVESMESGEFAYFKAEREARLAEEIKSPKK
jgi:ankyrin repeat protein